MSARKKESNILLTKNHVELYVRKKVVIILSLLKDDTFNAIVDQ